jgi:4-hydroxy-tetrahydrodipicolinate synthase
MRRPFTGVGTALVTPFRRDGSLDEPAVKRLARRQIDAGVHFLSPCGTTGEAPTLNHREKLRVVELVLEEANGGVPVLAGAGGYDTREVIQLAREYERIGVDGILSVTPYYNKPTQEGLFQHYKAIADSTALPIVLYNVPGRTGVNLETATVLRLSALPTIVGVKEASGLIGQIADVAAQAPEGFRVYSGDDGLTLPILSVGGYGLVSVVAHVVGAPLKEMIEAFPNNPRRALELHRKLMPVFKGMFAFPSPVPIKYATSLQGFDCESVRLPLVPLSDAQKEAVRASMAHLAPVTA